MAETDAKLVKRLRDEVAVANDPTGLNPVVALAMSLVGATIAEAADAIERLLAQRDAQVREAFDEGYEAGGDMDRDGYPYKTKDEAFAAFQARPSSGTGTGDKEQS